MKKVLTVFLLLIIGKLSQQNNKCKEGCKECDNEEDKEKWMGCLQCSNDYILVGPYCGNSPCQPELMEGGGGESGRESRRRRNEEMAKSQDGSSLPLSLSLSLSKKKKKKKKRTKKLEKK